MADYNEIEQRILDMWPKFDDGSYVWFGDAYIDANDDENEVVEVLFSKGNVDLVGLEGFYKGFYTGFNPSERVKRPAPKVLDADGVRILKGELLYGVGRSEHLFSVLDPYHIDPELGSAFSVRCIDLTEAEECHCKPELLAHAPEVLDADGVPIKVGDTVRHEDGTMLMVDGFGGIEDGEMIVNVHIIRGATPWREVRNLSLTHTRPDSWERLERDAEKSICDYFGSSSSPGSLCEDGCPGLNSPVSCGVLMKLDLIRRAKALAEKGAAR